MRKITAHRSVRTHLRTIFVDRLGPTPAFTSTITLLGFSRSITCLITGVPILAIVSSPTRLSTIDHLAARGGACPARDVAFPSVRIAHNDDQRALGRRANLWLAGRARNQRRWMKLVVPGYIWNASVRGRGYSA